MNFCNNWSITLEDGFKGTYIECFYHYHSGKHLDNDYCNSYFLDQSLKSNSKKESLYYNNYINYQNKDILKRWGADIFNPILIRFKEYDYTPTDKQILLFKGKTPFICSTGTVIDTTTESIYLYNMYTGGCLYYKIDSLK